MPVAQGLQEAIWAQTWAPYLLTSLVLKEDGNVKRENGD